jgi:hypothetical protein
MLGREEEAEDMLEAPRRSLLESGLNLSLCCSVTLTKQSARRLALQGMLPNDKNNGRDKADSVTVSLELVLFIFLTRVDDCTRVSEIEIWNGKTRPDESSIDGCLIEVNDSSSVTGIDRVKGEEEELAEEGDQEERKNEEERTERVTLETAS